MATVIDSLLVELGLDTSKFNDAQKKAVEGLRKVDEQNTKTQKEAQRQNKLTTESFEKSKDALVQLGTAFVGFSAMKQFIVDTANTNAGLSRQATLLGMSANALQAWGGVAEGFGSDAKSLQGVFQNIEGSIAKFYQGLGGENVKMGLGYLHLEDKDATNLLKVSNALKEYEKIHGIQETKNIAEMLGFGTNEFNMLLAGPDKLQKLYDAYVKINHLTPELEANSKAFQEKTATLTQSLAGLKNEMLAGTLPAANGFLDITAKMVQKFAEFDEKAEQAPSTLLAIGVAAATASSSLSFIAKIFGTTISTGWIAVFSRLLGAGALMFHSGSLGETPEVEEAIRKQNQERKFKGNIPRNIRNNNPGNMLYREFALKHGATGKDDAGFAVFPDSVTGQKALDDLLEKRYYNKGQNTIASIIGGINGQHAYSTTDQSPYIDYLSKKLGINPNQPLNLEQLHKMSTLIPYFEGHTGAAANTPASNTNSSTVHTSINNMNVYTQATDANGIMQDAHSALQQNALIYNGSLGNQ
jgi:hypothetical protein